MMRTAELLWHSMTSSATWGSCFSAFVLPVKMKRMRVDDAAITSEQCCHTLLYQDAASLGFWMHSIEAGVKTRFHLLHLTEERRCCAIRGCMKYNHLDPEDADTRFKNIMITVFMHSCKVSVAYMKCNMFVYVEGRCYVKVIKPTGSTWLFGSSLNFLNTLLTLWLNSLYGRSTFDRYTTSAIPLCDLSLASLWRWISPKHDYVPIHLKIKSYFS